MLEYIFNTNAHYKDKLLEKGTVWPWYRYARFNFLALQRDIYIYLVTQFESTFLKITSFIIIFSCVNLESH